jgi:hypothetical protein
LQHLQAMPDVAAGDARFDLVEEGVVFRHVLLARFAYERIAVLPWRRRG